MPKSPTSNQARQALLSIQRRYGTQARRAVQRSATARRTRHKDTGSTGGSEPPTRQGRSLEPARKRFPWVKRITLLLFLLILISGGVFGYKIIAAGDKISVADRSILGQLKDLLLSQDNVLAGEEEGRINIMLLAVGGEGHKGKDLADTIMVASIDPVTNQAALLSIPRDLYVQVPGEEYFSKINAVHAYGESQKVDQGPELLRELVSEITGLPIHYYARVDFTAFKGIVDAVGGINIAIDSTFFDYWHRISFPAGTEKMSGERSLAYVRARYIEGPEGGDFKRAARQQQVLLALREKVFSVQTALDFSKVNSILNSLSNNIRTDLELWEMKRFYEQARLIDPNSVTSIVLTSGSKGVLIGDTEVLGGVPASVLRPRTGDYSEIQRLADDIFTGTTNIQSPTELPTIAETPPAEPADKETTEPAEPPAAETEITKPTLEIRNATTINGLAKKTSDQLKQQTYEVVAIGNAATKDRSKTIVYYANDDHQAGAEALAQTLGATTSSSLPEGETATEAQALIILGTDANTTESE